MSVKKRKRSSVSDNVVDVGIYIILGIVVMCVAYPLFFILIASISDPTYVNAGKVIFFPKGITIEGYELLFDHKDVWTGYRNTLFYTITGAGIGVVLTMMIGYVLSVKRFKARKFIMIFLMITMYFNGGLIPTYLLIKSLNLLDTPMVMVMVGSVSVFNIILARTFISSTLSDELYEAAVIDGCTHFQYFGKIVMPLSKAIIAVLALYYGVWFWNDYFKGLIYLSNKNLFPLQLFLRSILVESSIDIELLDVEEAIKQQRLVEIIKYGLIIVSSLPVLVIYPFLQKYFVKGVMIGSVKG